MREVQNLEDHSRPLADFEKSFLVVLFTCNIGGGVFSLLLFPFVSVVPSRSMSKKSQLAVSVRKVFGMSSGLSRQKNLKIGLVWIYPLRLGLEKRLDFTELVFKKIELENWNEHTLKFH